MMRTMTVSVMVRAKHYYSSPGMSFLALWETAIMTVITFHGLGPAAQCANTHKKISKNPKLLSKSRDEAPKLSRLSALDADYWDKLPNRCALKIRAAQQILLWLLTN